MAACRGGGRGRWRGGGGIELRRGDGVGRGEASSWRRSGVEAEVGVQLAMARWRRESCAVAFGRRAGVVAAFRDRGRSRRAARHGAVEGGAVEEGELRRCVRLDTRLKSEMFGRGRGTKNKRTGTVASGCNMDFSGRVKR